MYCNWDVITSRSHRDQLITLHLDGKPIGFVTWRRDDKVVELEIIWTLPHYRGKGYGYKFQQLLIKEFKKRGDVAFTINCATKDGLSLARRNGFIPTNNDSDFRNENIPLGQATYIKILRNTEAVWNDDEELTIFCYERYGRDDSFYGELPLSADFDKQHVYWYVDENWECEISYKGDIIRQSKLKYVLKELNIRVYNYMVACIDHNIEVPQHWIK